jgi:hypothetical protein
VLEYCVIKQGVTVRQNDVRTLHTCCTEVNKRARFSFMSRFIITFCVALKSLGI